MKIGILTYHFSDNYGALLQAYGLYKWLEEAGHHVSFIPYHPHYVEEGGSFFAPTSLRAIKSNVKILYLKLSSLRARVSMPSSVRIGFENFRHLQLRIPANEVSTKEQLECVVGSYDLLICGSDQIWNPSEHFGVDPVYFLDFKTPNRPRRISYAASFGKNHLADTFTGDITKCLAALDAISVREESGVQIVKQLCNRDAAHVPDPTLLYGDFGRLLGTTGRPSERTVFVYCLRAPDGVREISQRIAEQEQLNIVAAYNPHRRWREIGRTVYLDPQGWLASIYDARYVITNSFHGAVFSILFKKPFVAVGLPSSKGALSERVLSLLDSVDLRDRFVLPHEVDSAMEVLRKPIDWEHAHGLLDEWRIKAEGWLKDQLQLAVASSHEEF